LETAVTDGERVMLLWVPGLLAAMDLNGKML
jgi:hypothetical protein